MQSRLQIWIPAQTNSRGIPPLKSFDSRQIHLDVVLQLSFFITLNGWIALGDWSSLAALRGGLAIPRQISLVVELPLKSNHSSSKFTRLQPPASPCILGRHFARSITLDESVKRILKIFSQGSREVRIHLDLLLNPLCIITGKAAKVAIGSIFTPHSVGWMAAELSNRI